MKKKIRLKRKYKITLYSIILLMILGLFTIEFKIGEKSLKNKNLVYSKESTINYITYLKNNTHYTDSYLKNDFNLVASLVDYFNMDYNYSYTINEKIKYTLTYNISAVLEVYDSDNNAKPVEKRNYELLKKTTVSGKSQTIKLNLFNQKIDYATYNKVIQNWKKEISPNANLKVLVNVSWSGYSKELRKNISDNCTSEFLIPISDKTMNIKDPTNISETGTIKGNGKLSTAFTVLITSTIVLFGIGVIYLTIYIFESSKNISKYDQKISKILREFDRAITEAKGEFIKYEGESYIEVNNFMELLDVHDNVNEPIIYYKNSNDLSVFVINNGKDTYYCALNRIDFED